MVAMVAKDVALCIGFAESREVVYWQMVSERERQTLAPLPSRSRYSLRRQLIFSCGACKNDHSAHFSLWRQSG